MEDTIIEIIGNALQGHFGCVETCPDTVYIDHNGETYSISITKCENCE